MPGLICEVTTDSPQRVSIIRNCWNIFSVVTDSEDDPEPITLRGCRAVAFSRKIERIGLSSAVLGARHSIQAFSPAGFVSTALGRIFGDVFCDTYGAPVNR